MELLNCADEKVTYALTSADIIADVYNEMGLTFNFTDAMPGDRLQEKE